MADYDDRQQHLTHYQSGRNRALDLLHQLYGSILDQGEAEVIVLALELNAELLIIDERPGRAIAQQNGIKIEGVVVGEGDTYEDALADMKSAIHCHIEIFGQEVLGNDLPLEAFVTEAEVAI